jgi:hypothetical protein
MLVEDRFVFVAQVPPDQRQLFCKYDVGHGVFSSLGGGLGSKRDRDIRIISAFDHPRMGPPAAVLCFKMG